jgi:hypothetical protein
MGEQIGSQLHGTYYEATYRRSVFSGGNVTGVTTTIGLAGTYVGLALTNPLASGFNLVLLKCGWALKVAQSGAAVIIGLMTSYNANLAVTQTVVVTPASNLIGLGAAPVGLLGSSITLPSSANFTSVRTILGCAGTAAVSDVTHPPCFFDIDGSIILPPGGVVAFFTDVVTATNSFFGSFLWEEVPV